MTKCEEALRQAEEFLRLAKEENAAADSELKAAREAVSPTPPPPAHPQGAAGLTLSSDDMVGLTNMLQQCGLLAVAVQGTEEEDGSSRSTSQHSSGQASLVCITCPGQWRQSSGHYPG